MWKMGGAPVRRTGKYAVTKEEYEPERYPSSCNGPCYFISDVANEKLVEESYKHEEFKLEDMYVTGVLRYAKKFHPSFIAVLEMKTVFLFLEYQKANSCASIWAKRI